MQKNEATPLLQAQIDAVTGAIFRHGPDFNTRTFLGMATYLGDGDWAAMSDNLFGGRVYGELMGTQQIIDIWIHTTTGEEFPVQWGHASLIKPLAILHAPNSGEPRDMEKAISAQLAFPEYQKVWRNSFGGARVFSDIGFDAKSKTVAVECCIFSQPCFAKWSAHRDENTPAVLAGMEYPGEKDAGGPIVDGYGRIAGMLLGPDYGTGDTHKGWYLPIDYITPSLWLARASLLQNRSSILNTIHFVGHRSNDVEF